MRVDTVLLKSSMVCISAVSCAYVFFMDLYLVEGFEVSAEQ